MREAPKILIFALPRLYYNLAEGRKVKDLRQFHFEKVIYTDKMHEPIIERIEALVKESDQFNLD